MKCHSIPGIYLVYTFQMKLCAPPGCRIAIEMQQHTGIIGLQGCLMFCRMWRRHWASARVRQWPDSGPGGQVAPPSRRRRRWNRRHRRPRQLRRGRAAAAADADVGGGGGVTQPPPTPTAAAARAHRRCRRRRRRSESLVDSI